MKLLCSAMIALAAVTWQQAPSEILASLFSPSTGKPQRPSAAIGYIVNGTAGMQMFGTITPSGGAAPDANTVYEIGSITKGLTGVMLADMALAGDVSLHDTLEKLLPEPARFPEAVRRITLLQLATHMSGLPRLPANLMFTVRDPANPYAHYGVAELETFLRAYAPPPDRAAITAEYSNLGFGLLGHVLSLQAGMPYEALLKARVLAPLGMRDTSIALSADQRARLAPGHARGVAVSNWDINVLSGAGAVRSTTADMTKLLQALMRPPDSRIGKAIRLALEPRADLGGSKVGLAWITTMPPGGVPFRWHNGGTGGYRSFIGFTQDGKAGLVVLTNGADLSPDPLAIQALQRLRDSAGL